MTKRQPKPTVQVVSIRMADGTDMSSPEAQQRIARALLGAPIVTLPKPSNTPAKTG